MLYNSSSLVYWSSQVSAYDADNYIFTVNLFSFSKQSCIQYSSHGQLIIKLSLASWAAYNMQSIYNNIIYMYSYWLYSIQWAVTVAAAAGYNDIVL